MFVFFFFQAENGIRDLVRCGGLGDGYKGQALEWLWSGSSGCGVALVRRGGVMVGTCTGEH